MIKCIIYTYNVYTLSQKREVFRKGGKKYGYIKRKSDFILQTNKITQ